MIAVEAVRVFPGLISLLLCVFENFQLIDLTCSKLNLSFPPTTTPLIASPISVNGNSIFPIAQTKNLVDIFACFSFVHTPFVPISPEIILAPCSK